MAACVCGSGRQPLSRTEQGTGDTSNTVQIKIVFPANPGAHSDSAANSNY